MCPIITPCSSATSAMRGLADIRKRATSSASAFVGKAAVSNLSIDGQSRVLSFRICMQVCNRKVMAADDKAFAQVETVRAEALHT